MKTKVLTTIVSALVATVTFADDTIYSLSDRMLMLEERTTSNEKKIKQLSSTQSKTTKSLNETKGQVEQLRHDQVRLELEQIRAENQPKVYTPKQYWYFQPERPQRRVTEEDIAITPSQYRDQPDRIRQAPDAPIARFSDHPEFVISPYTGRLVSIRGIPPRQLVKDPLCGHVFRIP